MSIKTLEMHNKALPMKLLWRYTQKEQAFWKEAVNTKHGVQNHSCTKSLNLHMGLAPGSTYTNYLYMGLAPGSAYTNYGENLTKFPLCSRQWNANQILDRG